MFLRGGGKGKPFLRFFMNDKTLETFFCSLICRTDYMGFGHITNLNDGTVVVVHISNEGRLIKIDHAGLGGVIPDHSSVYLK